jgi:hypothetical protein
MGAFLRRHAAAVSLVSLVAIGGVVFVAVWFQPQKLVIDETVQESTPPATTEVLARGSFRDRAHHASGTVRVLALPGGERVLRLEDLDVENGPDLYVYLTEAKADAPNDAFGSRFVSLGRLKGNKGNQSYAIPAGVDLARYASAVIWCKRFSTVFGTASLA